MNIFLQIAFGTVPAILLLGIYLLIFKRNLPAGIVSIVLFLGVAGAGIALNVTQDDEEYENAASPEIINTVGYEEVANLAYGYILSENCEEAQELLQETLNSYSYTKEYTLAMARINALLGKFRAAKALYEKIEGGMPEEIASGEYAYVVQCLELENVDITLQEHFDMGDSSADAGALKDQKQALKQTLYAAVQKQIQTELGENANKYTECARALEKADEIYASYIAAEKDGTPADIDTDMVDSILSELDDMEKQSPQMSQINPVRLTKLKLQLLNGDFKEMAQELDAHSDYQELLIISELYRNGYIKESYFTGDYALKSTEMMQAVIGQMQEVLENHMDTAGKEEQKAAEEYLHVMQDTLKKPALMQFKEELYQDVQNADYTDSSKIYLQLAKLELETKNQEKTYENLTNALNAAPESDDASYAEPMQRIVNVIENKDNAEDLKNVAGDVQEVQSEQYAFDIPQRYLQEKISDDDSEAENGSGQSEFTNEMVDYASKKRASININSVDVSEFETVRAIISIDGEIASTAEELKNLIAVNDCGADITDYTVEKVTYKGINVLLCCDVSGSMEGSAIVNMKEAVSLFIDNKLENENIALVTFNDSIESEYGFDTPVEELSEAAEAIYANGDTDMYKAAIHSIDFFKNNAGYLNCMILLSDGEDNNPQSAEDIQTYLGDPCKRNNIVMYSIGLGNNADANYLSTLAESTGGSYLHVNDSETLYTFYEYLEAQMQNQYVITYTAKDTLTRNRELTISQKEDELSYDVEYYYLNTGNDVTNDDVQTGEGVISMKDCSVIGLDTRLLYKSSVSAKIHLLGKGFNKTDTVKVSLDGNLDYDVKSTFIDGNTIELEIPGSIACGTYNVNITINGRMAILAKELVVVTQGSETTTKFGPYVFTSYSKTVSDDQILLSGYVCMNNWLHFQDDVILFGSQDDLTMTMTDLSGSYIHYSRNTSEGLAAFLAGKGMDLKIPALGDVVLYNDQMHDASSDEYQVERTMIPLVYISNVITYSTPSVALYPDRIVIDANGFTTKFPYQDELIKKTGIEKAFKFDLEAKALLTNKNIGIDIEFNTQKTDNHQDSASDSEDDTEKTDSAAYHPCNFGNMPIYLNFAEFELKINTIENEYSIKYMTRVAFLAEDGVGLKLGWDGDSLMPDEIRLYCNKDISTYYGAIPITLTGFELAVKDIDLNEPILNWALEGVMDIKASKVSAVYPGLEKYVGDKSIASLDDITVDFSLGQGYLKAKAAFHLLDQIELANASIEAGKIQYSNILLNMNNVSVNGFTGKVSGGVKWDSDNCDIDLSGKLELAIHSRFIGITLGGNADISVEWWIFVKDFSIEGKASVGMYKDSRDNATFGIWAKGQKTNGKTKGIAIIWSGSTGLDVDTKYL